MRITPVNPESIRNVGSLAGFSSALDSLGFSIDPVKDVVLTSETYGLPTGISLTYRMPSSPVTVCIRTIPFEDFLHVHQPNSGRTTLDYFNEALKKRDSAFRINLERVPCTSADCSAFYAEDDNPSEGREADVLHTVSGVIANVYGVNVGLELSPPRIRRVSIETSLENLPFDLERVSSAAQVVESLRRK